MKPYPRLVSFFLALSLCLSVWRGSERTPCFSGETVHWGDTCTAAYGIPYMQYTCTRSLVPCTPHPAPHTPPPRSHRPSPPLPCGIEGDGAVRDEDGYIWIRIKGRIDGEEKVLQEAPGTTTTRRADAHPPSPLLSSLPIATTTS
jgi:hypothetical protein